MKLVLKAAFAALVVLLALLAITMAAARAREPETVTWLRRIGDPFKPEGCFYDFYSFAQSCYIKSERVYLSVHQGRIAYVSQPGGMRLGLLYLSWGKPDRSIRYARGAFYFWGESPSYKYAIVDGNHSLLDRVERIGIADYEER